jgi:hypothetical protein
MLWLLEILYIDMALVWRYFAELGLLSGNAVQCCSCLEILLGAVSLSVDTVRCCGSCL